MLIPRNLELLRFARNTFNTSKGEKTMTTILIKKRGFENYYEAQIEERVSKRGNHYFNVVAFDEVSRGRYYKENLPRLCRHDVDADITCMCEIQKIFSNYDKKTVL